jgi:Flp pilus assembly protein TadG
MRMSRRKKCKGGSALEMALLLPWYMFLFVGAFDWGYYAHALISTESAARVAGTYAATSSTTATDTTNVCLFALQELSIVPNVSGVTTCSGSSPVRVTASLLTNATTPASADGQNAAQVSVQYTTLQLIPIPLLLQSQATFYRTVEMRLRS